MKKSLVLVGIALSVFSFQSRAEDAAEYHRSTNKVWEHHIAAWNDRDADSIVLDYDDNSILIINGQIFRGTLEIKTAFEQLFEIFNHGDNVIDPAVVDGSVIYLTWHFSPVGESALDGTDTFIVRDGRIEVQTIASKLYRRFPLKK